MSEANNENLEDKTKHSHKNEQGVEEEAVTLNVETILNVGDASESELDILSNCDSSQNVKVVSSANNSATNLLNESNLSVTIEQEKEINDVEQDTANENTQLLPKEFSEQKENNDATVVSLSSHIPGDATSSILRDEVDDNQSIYNVKWITYQNKSLPIVTQNENGPCPLIAIMNYLFLQQMVKLPPGTVLITSSNLFSHLADYIFDHVPEQIDSGTRLSYEHRIHDAIAMFPKLYTGLDVNIKFTGVTHFEYTSSSEVFDLLDIPLYHGWLVDPDNLEEVMAVGQNSYNQLVERIIIFKSSTDSEELGIALLAEEFLKNSASQITYHGLSKLASTLENSEMGVLFRNNHFHTILKHNEQLYVLATDHGFLHESGVVWETLSNIEGDSHFVDAGFNVFQQSAAKSLVQTSSVVVNTEEQIQQDFEIAVRIQDHENRLAEVAPSNTNRQQAPPPCQQRQRASTTSSSSVTKDKKPMCSVM